jgi:hypothetical protein
MFELIQSIHSVEVEFESGSYYCTGTCTRIDRETFTWHGMAWHGMRVQSCMGGNMQIYHFVSTNQRLI